MKSERRHLAIIPARSGSKRFPGKNVALLGGLPLLAWTVKTALSANLFHRVILSVDHEEYARVGIEYGAECPWLRAAELAADDTPSHAVVADVLQRLAEQGEQYDRFTLLQPTSPLRSVQDLHEAEKLMNTTEGDAVVSLVRCEHPPQWSNTLPGNGNLSGFINPKHRVPANQLATHYRVNGAIFMAHTETYLSHLHFFTPKSRGYLMPRERSVDIDEPFDLLVAETIIQQKKYTLPWTT